jgi:hypothetical protein
MDKTSALGFRFPDEMKAALVAAAKGDDRPVSSLVTIILRVAGSANSSRPHS